MFLKKRNAFFTDSYKSFIRSALKTKKRFDLNESDFYPCVDDNQKETYFDTHYIYHPAWAVRILQQTKPTEHVDISSTLHFCSILSAFLPVRFYDYRPANVMLSQLSTGFADLQNLDFPVGSIPSLSCMHTVEHVGLGRYGEPIDYDGNIKAMLQLKKVLSNKGNFLFVVPIGEIPKIIFNAHRIYTFNQILEYFDGLILKEFSFIPDNAISVGMIKNATQEQIRGNKYGCGCFWFSK